MEYPVSSSSSSSSPLSASSSRLSPRRAPLHYERTGPTGRRSPSISYVDATGINSFSPSPSGPPLTLTLASSHSASYSSASSHQLTSLSSPSTNITPTPVTTTTMATATSSTSSSTANHSKLSPNRSNRSPSVSPVRETGLPVGYINQRRNTLPKHSAQYLSPEARNTGDATVFSRYRSNSYYNRSPSHRRRRSFKEPPATSASANTSPSSSSTITTIVGPYASSAARRVSALEQDTWDSYSALIKSSQDRRKMSLPVSEPISPGWTTKFINVIIVGGPNVGKYSLVRHLVDDENNASKTRVDPNSSLDKSVNVHRLNFPLYDTHIEIIFEYYQNVNKIMDTVTDNGCKVRHMDILIVMYSVTDRRSFEMSAQYLTNAVFTCKKMNPDLVISLVANKTDLVRVREVSSEEGRSLAVKFEVPFMEVSIELDDNFELIVEWLTNVIKDKLKIGDPTQSSGLSTTPIKKNVTLSGRAFRFVKKILNRRGSKSKSCDNINLM